MNTEKRTEYLYGQIDALKTVCMALIYTHNNPNLVLKTLEIFSEIALAKNTATTATDISLDATRGIIDDFRKTLVAVCNQEHPGTQK